MKTMTAVEQQPFHRETTSEKQHKSVAKTVSVVNASVECVPNAC